MGLRREKRPSDLAAADGAAPVNRLVATVAWLSDHYAEVVTAFRAGSGEIKGHVSRSLTLLAVLSPESNRKLFEAFSIVLRW